MVERKKCIVLDSGRELFEENGWRVVSVTKGKYDSEVVVMERTPKTLLMDSVCEMANRILWVFGN